MNKCKLSHMVVCCAIVALLCLVTSAMAEDVSTTPAASVAAPAASEATTVPSLMSPAASPITPPPDYVIHEEDVLKLDVWGEQQLSNLQMQVTPDGKINVAYLGDITAAGLTQAQLTQTIAKKFEEMEILVNPKIQITILILHKPVVRVLGSVARSGEFPFKEGDRVLDAVAQAGYTDNSWLEKVTLTHSGSNQQPIIIDFKKILSGKDLSQNYELQKGDVINIPPEDYANKIYVMGQVLRPTMYDLKDRITVLAAVNLAGGPTERAEMRSTIVIRGSATNADGTPAKAEKVRCNLAKLFDKGDISQDLVLQPGDVVYVPETKRPDWPKISQILSTITSLSYVRRLGLF